MSDIRAYRSSVLHCLGDPGVSDDARDVEYFADGLLIVEGGRVSQLGPAEALLGAVGDSVPVTDLRDFLLIPGMIDCHVHYPQIDMIASYGAQLLDWLNRYAYPEEEKFRNAAHAHEVAEYFAGELLKNGTTSALVFPTVHRASVDAMFEAARTRNMRLLTGKVLMDAGCPEALRDTADLAYRESRELIEKWHGLDRLGYAITPRFALTSTAAQLEAAGKLAGEFPDVHVHTHLAENHGEVAAVARRFPESRSYLDVYRQYGLLRHRSVFAHCLHLDDTDRRHMSDHGGAIAFCPSSNLFLGSGLFDLKSADDAGIATGIGTDVGGGTSLSMLRTLGDAYKVLQLRGQSLPAYKALYLATLGAAKALDLDDRIGNFASGKEADFVVLDPAATAMTARRTSNAEHPAERLFALMTLGDDRQVYATYVMGQPVHQR